MHRRPRFIAGLVVIPDGLEPPEKDSVGNVVIEERRFWPIFGHHVRPIVAGSMEHPGENIFFGLSFPPILASIQSGDASLQIVGGYRWQTGGDEQGWFGATVDFKAAIQSLLAKIGVGG